MCEEGTVNRQLSESSYNPQKTTVSAAMANTTSVAKMTPQELEENVKKAIKLKQQQHETFVRTGGVTKFLSAARHSLLFQPSCNWNDMLSGAPISISIMGSIFIASTSPGAEGILLVPPQAGFKSIKYVSVNRTVI